MDRTQHKCFLASALLHGALLAAVVVVSAFSKAPPDLPKTALTYVPINAKDLAGAPPAAPDLTDVAPPPTPPPPTPPSPPPPAPAPKVETKLPTPVKDEGVPAKKPTPPKDKGLLPPKEKSKPKDEAKKPAPPKVEKVEPKKAAQPKKDEPKIKLASTDHLVPRSNPTKETDSKSKASESDAKKRADQYAKMRTEWEKNLQGAIGGLKSGLSSPITIDTPGAGASAFLSYGAEIVSRYERNWLVPADAIEDNSVVQIVVTIARDGHVIDARVVRPCGRAVVDKSVRETLQRVRVFPPFPAGSTDEQRTFNVDFNLKAKRSAG